MILRLARALARNRRGSATEFALTLPIWVITILAVVNIGRFFVARAGIQNGLGEAARVATLWPRQSEDQIRTAFANGTFGLSSSEAPELDFSTGTANGQAYIDLAVEYEPQFYLMFVQISPVTLNYSRRAFRPA